MTGIIPGRLKYLVGDTSKPEAGGHRMILHLVDDSGQWEGSSVADALMAVWPRSKQEYRRWYLAQRDFRHGNILEINLRSDTTVACMLAETKKEDSKLLDLDMLSTCFDKTSNLALTNGSSIHIQKLDMDDDVWLKIEAMMIEYLVKRGLNVFVYTKEPYVARKIDKTSQS